jgi:hypothetical protein
LGGTEAVEKAVKLEFWLGVIYFPLVKEHRAEAARIVLGVRAGHLLCENIADGNVGGVDQ